MRRFTSLAFALLTILTGTLLITTPAARATAPATTSALAESYQFETSWGVAGGGAGQLRTPQDLAAQGRFLYVMDGDNLRTNKFRLNGEYLTHWGAAPYPNGISLDRAGNVYVAESYANRVQKYTGDGIFLATIVPPTGPGYGSLNQPHDVAVDANGNIFVADTYNGRVLKFDSQGSFLRAWGSWGSGEGQFSFHDEIAIDASGFVYVSETGNNRIQKFTNDGAFVTKWGSPGSGPGQLSSPRGIAVDGQGGVWVADTNNHRVQKFTDSGTFITTIGTQGSGDGQFRGPWGVTVDQTTGKVYVADTYNSRIQVFAPAGTPPPPSEPPPGPPDGVCPRPDGAVFPPNGGTIDDNTPTFVFHGVVGHNLYRLQVANDSTFAQPLADSGGFTGDYALTTPLGAGSYYWRAACRTNEGVWRPWGAPWSFTLAAPPPPNQPPTAQAGGPYSVPEGGSVALSGSGSDPDGDALTYRWDLDNNGSFETAGQSPTFSAAGRDGPSSQTVALQVCDGSGACATSSSTVNIANVAPTATFNAPASVDEGSPFTISLSAPVEPSPVDFAAGLAYAFDCGGGYGAYGAASSVSCPTTDNGTLAVKGKVRDKDGGETEYTASVTVNNVPPTIQSVANSGPINEGSSATITVTATDPAGPADPLVLRADCNNDGSFETIPIEMVALQLVSTASLPCAFQDNGTFQVNVQVSDGDNGVVTAATTVVVNNVAPAAVLANSGPISEGGTATISFSSQFDPSPADTAAGFRYAYDCNGGSLAAATYGSGGASASTTCAYADNGSYTVRARIIDKDGGYTEYTTVVTVNNVAPTVNAGADAVLYSGQILSLRAGFTDPGINDAPWSYAIDWGDSTSGSGSTGSQGAGVISASHQYFIPGTYTVKVCVTDKDNGKGCDDLTVEVKRLVVRIDIKPGSDPNSINLRSRGNVPVGILGGTYSGVALDATTIVRSTVVFAGAAALAIGGSPEDVNGDGRLDVVYHFDTQALSLTRGSTQGCLTGRTSGNLYFEGCDSVRIVP